MVRFSFPKIKLDKIMQINQRFKLDPSKQKINLAVGTYKQHGHPYVFQCVDIAKQQILCQNHEYRPIDGDPLFLDKTKQLYFGRHSNYDAVQTLSGTGALKLCADILSTCNRTNLIYVPSPTWGNHYPIFSHSQLNVKEYGYLQQDKSFDFRYIYKEIRNIPDGVPILFHGCAHNPTGYDLTRLQWEAIFHLCQAKALIIIIDMAYLGFASGNVDKDRMVLDSLQDYPYPNFICTSFAKNFGLYGERVGNLFFRCSQMVEMKQHIIAIIRRTYSNPPCNGAKIITAILSSDVLTDMWKRELVDIHTHLTDIRCNLRRKLEAALHTDFDDITQQKGMFYYSKLTPKQIDIFYKNHIYFPDDGRISIGELNTKNMDRFVDTWIQAIQT